MTTYQTALSAFFILAGVGTVFLIIGAIRKISISKKYMRCTSYATGHVVDYYYKGEMRVGPIVEFADETGRAYKVKKQFRGYKQIVKVPNGGSSIWEDKRGYLHTRRGAIGRWRDCAEETWPIGLEMNVFYDPKAPTENNYVDRVLKDDVAVILFLTGLGLMLLGIIMNFVIQHA